MPELPDIELYLSCLRQRVAGHTLNRLRISSPFVLRTFEPAVEAVEGLVVHSLRRIGKRIVFELPRGEFPAESLFIVVHLMIAGRFRWSEKLAAKSPGKIGLAAFEFDNGTLTLVESSQQKRASIHIVDGTLQLDAVDPGGVNVLKIDLHTFTARIRAENHTIKRTLTDPHVFDGIGNAYSDEILHAARLSPVKLTQKLSDAEIAGLYEAARLTLATWIERLRHEFDRKFPGPGDVTAFRPDFAVHGKFGQPCPSCSTKVQRIRYADNETNYCPRCQTEGKVLADRSLSRLLKKDWPGTIEELEDSR
jgi:formamidopyrimidine-DNA glycosylase